MEYNCGKCNREYELPDGTYRATAFIVCPDCHPDFEAEYQEALGILRKRKEEGDEQAGDNYRELLYAVGQRMQYVNPSDYL